MRDAQLRRQAETVVRQAPQWQNLFLAPDYPDDVAEDAEEGPQPWQEPAPNVPRRRRGGRRMNNRAA